MKYFVKASPIPRNSKQAKEHELEVDELRRQASLRVKWETRRRRDNTVRQDDWLENVHQ